MRTLVEIISPNITTSTQVVYTVSAGQRLVITDVISTSVCGLRHIYRNGVEVSRADQYSTTGLPTTSGHSYQSGIEFGEGQTVAVGIDSSVGIVAPCSFPAFFELRGYLEAL